ncbi:MAG TPA: NUDIX hydrolase [Ktedonobacterales bacterium]|jgi:ADP-ribose pyrophosphatase YjhB (NUDIX family)
MSLPGPFPKKRMAAGALFFNTSQKILIVKPVYRPFWLLPGGVVEDGESPRQACMREIKEELGLEIAVERLLCVDYKAQQTRREEGMEFVFFGGVLGEESLGQIRLQAQELETFQFVSLDEAVHLLNPWSAKRLPFAVKAQREEVTLYLEDGQSVS